MDLKKNKMIALIPSNPTFTKYIKQIYYYYVCEEQAIFKGFTLKIIMFLKKSVSLQTLEMKIVWAKEGFTASCWSYCGSRRSGSWNFLCKLASLNTSSWNLPKYLAASCGFSQLGLDFLHSVWPFHFWKPKKGNCKYCRASDLSGTRTSWHYVQHCLWLKTPG